MISSFVIPVWLASIVLLALRDREPLKFRRLLLIRALFPTWRFFDRLEQVPKAFVRVRSGQGEFGAWNALRSPRRRGWTSLFLNPDGNLEFAFNSLTELLVAEANESADPEDTGDSVSCQLMVRAVRDRLACGLLPGGDEFQFKISILDARTRNWIGDLLISPVYPVKRVA